MLGSHEITYESIPPTVVAVGPVAAEEHRPRLATARVLHLINGEHYSGAERVQDLLAARLPDYGYEVGFVCVRPGRFPSDRQSQSAPLSLLPMHGRIDLRPAWGVARLVRAEGYVLIHAHTPRTAILARLAAALCGKPFVYHVHSPASRDSTRRWNDWANAFAERWFLRRAARLICVSQSLARHMEQAGFPVEKLRVVSNGVPAADVKRDHRRPTRTWTLGSVALFRPRKGLEVLITALARLQKSFVPVRLRLVGPFETPEYESQVKSLARRQGVDTLIDWVGFSRDVNAELAKMDLFVLPSLFGEGLPMVVLEAMAAGVPVVGTRVEGVPEAIRSERDGLIADANDPDDLARKINSILHGDYSWSALRSSALSRHAERFSDAAMAAGVAAVYDELVERAEPSES